MDPRVTMAAAAGDNPLAAWAAERLNASFDHSDWAQRVLPKLRGAVVLVAPDEGLSTTLRFDAGAVTIHDGTVGRPDVTFCADEAGLQALSKLRFASFLGRVLPRLTGAGRGAWIDLAGAMGRGSLTVYGSVSRPRLFWRALRLLADRDG